MVDTDKADKVSGVSEFLRAEFPGCTIEEGRATEGPSFEISFQGSGYIVIVSDEFLRKHDRLHIGKVLSKYTLIEHLRDLPGTPVLVTSTGLKLQYE